jgi:ribonuclease T2
MLVEKAFVTANPGMKPDGISVACNRNYLQEVRICMTKDLKFRACEQVNANACRSRSVMMPATR